MAQRNEIIIVIFSELHYFLKKNIEKEVFKGKNLYFCRPFRKGW